MTFVSPASLRRESSRGAAWAVACVVCAAANVTIAGAFGYTNPLSFAGFWGALALAGIAGWRLARSSSLASASDVAVRGMVLTAAVVIGCMMIAGAAARLRLASVLLGEAVVASAAWMLPRRTREAVSLTAAQSVPLPVVAICAALLIYAIAFGVWFAPFTLYDSISYHLHFAARWVQDQAIAIIPTPFSDEAQAYAPGNGELWFAWLMLPFHGDVLARMGQFPFALLAAAALVGTGRRLGRSVTYVAYPPAFLLLSRPILEQMVGADVDLICAAFFACAMYFALVAVDTDDARDWAMFGVSAGLYAGTKYVALVYLPVLVLLALARGPRLRALWALPGLAAFAAPWYLRNWVVAGSPIYPASLAVAGVTLAHGAFTRASMLNTVFHVSQVRLLFPIAARAVGPALFLVWLPCAIGGWILMARRGWWPYGAIAAVPIAMVPLFWLGFPVNSDSRFLMPAIAPALMPLAFLFSSNRRWNACVHGLYAAAMVWLIVGAQRSLPAGTVPWFMGGWTALNGLFHTQYLAWFAAVAAGAGALWLIVRRTPRVAVPVFAGAIACGGAVLTAAAPAWCGGGGCAYFDTTPQFVRVGYEDSWRWIDKNISNATIAYTGINLPYPLTGEKLTNRVVYLNIDGRPRWRFHDYDREYRAGRFAPRPPLLATSSGELMPVPAAAGPRDDALRPRYERMDGDREAWEFNFERLGVQYLYVAALSAYELDYVSHNEREFPVEDDWAQSDPGRFHLAYANAQVHIYAFDPAGPSQ